MNSLESNIVVVLIYLCTYAFLCFIVYRVSIGAFSKKSSTPPSLQLTIDEEPVALVRWIFQIVIGGLMSWVQLLSGALGFIPSRRLKAHSFIELRSHSQRQAREIKVLFELTCEFYKELGILETWEFIFLNYLFVFESAWTTPPANSSKCRNLTAEGFCRFQFNSSGKSPSHHRISVISSAARYQPPTGKLKGDGVTPWRSGNWFVFIVNATVCISNEGQTSKLWSSQLWTQFKQLRIETWKGQDFNGVWTRDLAIPVRLSNQLSPDFFSLLSWHSVFFHRVTEFL